MSDPGGIQVFLKGEKKRHQAIKQPSQRVVTEREESQEQHDISQEEIEESQNASGTATPIWETAIIHEEKVLTWWIKEVPTNEARNETSQLKWGSNTYKLSEDEQVTRS